MGQQQGLQTFYAPTLQLGPNRRHHDQADSQTGFSTGRWYTVVELFLTLSKTLILALILILGGNQKHIYLRLKSILKFQGKFEHWWLILIIPAHIFYSARKTQYKSFMSQLEREWSKAAKKRYQFQSTNRIFATSRTIIESIFEDQKSIFVCERTNCESPAGRFSTGPWWFCPGFFPPKLPGSVSSSVFWFSNPSLADWHKHCALVSKSLFNGAICFILGPMLPSGRRT